MNAEKLRTFTKDHKIVKKIALAGTTGTIILCALAGCASKVKEDPISNKGMCYSDSNNNYSGENSAMSMKEPGNKFEIVNLKQMSQV